MYANAYIYILRRRYFLPRKGKKCPDRPPNNRGTAGPAISADKKGREREKNKRGIGNEDGDVCEPGISSVSISQINDKFSCIQHSSTVLDRF